MSDRLRIEDFLNAHLGDSEPDWETFLVEEGLELLAAYRAINDKKIRLALLNLVKLATNEPGVEL